MSFLTGHSAFCVVLLYERSRQSGTVWQWPVHSLEEAYGAHISYLQTPLAGMLVLVMVVALLAACSSQSHAGSTPTATTSGATYGDVTTPTPSGIGEEATPSPTPVATQTAPLVPPTDPLAVCTADGGAALSVRQSGLNSADRIGARLPNDMPLKPVLYPPASAQQTVSLNASELMTYTFSTPPAGQIG